MNALVSFEYLAVSPSSRRAWIEIPVFPEQTTRNKVALLAEGVDRNMGEVEDTPWMPTVALLAEGVDRNTGIVSVVMDLVCRPPRGGRG